MKHATDIYITNEKVIILYCDPKSSSPKNYWVLANDNNMNTFFEKDLKKSEARKIFEKKVIEAKGLIS